MKKIRQQFKINASVETVYRALTDPILIEQWSEAKALMNDYIGGRFSLFNGYIVGQNLEVKPNARISQNWRLKNWTDLSHVQLELKRDGKGTIVDLLHDNIPDTDYVNVQQGWNRSYLGKLQRFFERRSA